MREPECRFWRVMNPTQTETVDSRRRIIEQTNGSVSDSEFCEIPTGGKKA